MVQPIHNATKTTYSNDWIQHPAQHQLQRLQNAQRQVNSKRSNNCMANIFGNLMSATKQIWMHFIETTTIHGFSQIHGKWNNKYEKCFWCIIVLLAVMGYAHMCLVISKRFQESKLETIVESSRRSVFKVPFPVITICNVNHLNWQRFEAAKTLYLGNVTDTETIETFSLLIGAFDVLEFANFKVFDVLENRSLDAINELPFYKIVDFMTWKCDELLRDCKWKYKSMNCCDIFSKRHGKNGLCWSFNTLETEEGRYKQSIDPKWPWRVSGAGPGSALRLKVSTDHNNFHPNIDHLKGIKVMISEPYVWHADTVYIPVNTNTRVQIQPVINIYDNNTARYNSTQRKCVFNREIPYYTSTTLEGYVYMLENCISQCHQEYMLKYCNCTIKIFFPPNSYPSCTAKGLLCLARHQVYFLYTREAGEEEYIKSSEYGMNCTCFNNCYSINYLVSLYSQYLPPEIRQDQNFIDLDVHFIFDKFTVYRTRAGFTWQDLMISFGGIAGLFLGCSLISGVEMIYLFIIRIPKLVFAASFRPNESTITTADNQSTSSRKRQLADRRFKTKLNVIAVEPYRRYAYLNHNYQQYSVYNDSTISNYQYLK